jgi:hypothetical protein
MPSTVAQTHRQDRLRALERLHLALLVHAQHQRMLGRIEVQANDRQVAMHRGRGQSGLIGQAASRPVSLTGRLLLQRRVDQLGDSFLGGGAGPTRLKFIVQPGNNGYATNSP